VRGSERLPSTEAWTSSLASRIARHFKWPRVVFVGDNRFFGENYSRVHEGIIYVPNYPNVTRTKRKCGRMTRSRSRQRLSKADASSNAKKTSSGPFVTGVWESENKNARRRTRRAMSYAANGRRSTATAPLFIRLALLPSSERTKIGIDVALGVPCQDSVMSAGYQLDVVKQSFVGKNAKLVRKKPLKFSTGRSSACFLWSMTTERLMVYQSILYGKITS
jgi:hypothetical protein